MGQAVSARAKVEHCYIPEALKDSYLQTLGPKDDSTEGFSGHFEL